jgi:hypothetical protein
MIFMIYVYVDYTLEEASRPFYVGKGNDKRIHNLIRNCVHSNIVEKYGQVRKIVYEVTALNYEIELIKQLKTKHGEEGHWGANLTWGGEGFSGFVMSEESKQKRRNSLTGRKLSEEHITKIREKRKFQTPPLLGKKFSEIHKQRIKKSLKNNPKLKRAPHNKGKQASYELRKKLSEAHKGIKISDDVKLKISLKLKGRESPMKGRKHSSETRQKMRESHQKKDENG